MKAIKKYVLWMLLGIALGLVCGLCGVMFSKVVTLVTTVRTQNDWLLYFLPLGGLLLVGIYKLCRVKNTGTTSVFDSVRTEQDLPNGLAASVFCGSAISHLFGASVGREGAALQIGGGLANIFARFLKLDEHSRRITIMCGMAAVFSAVFGTPLAACVFVLEIIFTRLCFVAALPVLLSSITAYIISSILKVHAERFVIGNIPQFSLSLIWKTATITIAGILVSFIFCKGISLGKRFAKKIFKNEFLRIAVGGTIIILLTLLIGNYEYNGGGIDIITRVFDGTVKYEAFAVKMLFTIICVSCGYKGGEIIPTLFIGATLGGALAITLGLPISTGAAIGMAVLFVCVTKCPAATILLCCEMFGFTSAIIIIPVVIVSFIAARYQGLYNNSNDLFNIIKERKKV